MLVSTLLFFLFGVLTIKELEEIPWNIILLFSGAMSIGFCLWKTGAAKWMAVNWLVHVPEGPLDGFRARHRVLRAGHDQLHHERGGHRHIAARVPGHRQVPGRGAGGHPLSRPW